MAGMAGIEPTSQVLETCLRPSLTPRLKSATNALFGKEVLKNWLDSLALKQKCKSQRHQIQESTVQYVLYHVWQILAIIICKSNEIIFLLTS